MHIVGILFFVLNAFSRIYKFGASVGFGSVNEIQLLNNIYIHYVMVPIS